jgi:hypothetical protein
MGYRSNVCIIFYARKPEHYPVIKLFVEENFPAKEDGYELFTKTEHPEKCMLEYRAEDVKWYDSFNSVQDTEAFMDKFAEMFDSGDNEIIGAYEFIRTGEELEDIEERRSSYADYFLGISREFYIA